MHHLSVLYPTTLSKSLLTNYDRECRARVTNFRNARERIATFVLYGQVDLVRYHATLRLSTVQQTILRLCSMQCIDKIGPDSLVPSNMYNKLNVLKQLIS